MKVMFDSNTWRLVVNPEQHTSDPDYTQCKAIHDAIIAGKIEAFLSETIFTIEAIIRKHRQGYFAKMKPKTTSSEKVFNETIRISISLEPNEDDAILFDQNTQILKEYFEKAVKMGFRIVCLPRIGGIVNPEVKKNLYSVPNFNEFFERGAEVSEKITSMGAGYAWIKKYGEKYNHNWLKGIKNSPVTENKKISKAAAEWADGESVSICIGLGCDYFCTRDQACGAGSDSVFSVANQEWLKRDYGFKTVNITELAEKL